VGPIEPADRICLDVGLTELANGGCARTLLRLNADGTLDESFHFGEPGPPANVAGQDVPYPIAVFPDASMLVRMNDARHAGSGMTFLDGEGRETRRPGLGEALARPTPPTAAAAMSDGGVLLAASDWFVRVRPDGTLDPGFRPLHTYVSARKILAQGHKVLILDDSGELVRLNPDGTRDPGFQTPAFKAYSN
jgi:hypothetical protein